jgi:glycosyltransferase involved in cell wall biosynthesis
LKLSVITPEFVGHGGGIITYYRALAAGLRQTGFSVHVVSGSGFHLGDGARKTIESGIVAETIDAQRMTEWLPRFAHLGSAPLLQRLLSAAWAAHAQAREAGPFDVIEVADFPLLALPHMIEPLAPTVIQCHGSYGQISMNDPSPGNEMDGAIALSLETASLSGGATVQTYAAANAAYWSAQSGSHVSCLRPAWSGVSVASGEGLLDQFSVFGRIQRWKGPQVLCEALRLIGSTPPVMWHGRDVAMSAKGASTNAWLGAQFPDIWGSRIKTAAPVPPEQVAAIQSRSRLNLVPSTWDVFNFTVVEAMHSGRPVICSDGAGASELIEDGVTGFVYEGSSPNALAAALERALALPEERLVEIGMNAREYIAMELNPQKIAKERIIAYGAAIEANKQPRQAIPDWVKQIAMPRGPGDGSLPFLEQQPLRKLTQHVGERIMRKLGIAS